MVGLMTGHHGESFFLFMSAKMKKTNGYLWLSDTALI
jgi:hypothetical protein